MITVNKARCKKCNEIIESKHRHDYVTCSCGSLSVDGGTSYLKRSGNMAEMEELSEFSLSFYDVIMFCEMYATLDTEKDTLHKMILGKQVDITDVLLQAFFVYLSQFAKDTGQKYLLEQVQSVMV